MTWFKVDDGLHAHRKVRAVRRSSDTKKRDIAPMAIWVLAGSWCGAHRTDGFIPREVIEDWDDDAEDLAQRLIDAGLWYADEVGGEQGYVFHDWQDQNPASKASTSGVLGNHERWHVGKKGHPGKPSSDCELCLQQGLYDPSIAPDIAPESGGDSKPESQNHRLPDPTRPDPTRSKKLPSASVGSEFDTFWKLYPRKKGKGAAEKAWVKAVKTTDPGTIIGGLREQLPNLQMNKASDHDFRPYPATWLNSRRWEDEPDQHPHVDPNAQWNNPWAN